MVNFFVFKMNCQKCTDITFLARGSVPKFYLLTLFNKQKFEDTEDIKE